LINISTLGALVLEQARPGGKSEVTARHFIDFVRAVRERHAFQKLRLLIMCDFGIGRRSILDGVTDWPALQMIGLQNSKSTISGDIHLEDTTCWKQLEQQG
jgi:hypothetical protein